MYQITIALQVSLRTTFRVSGLGF